MDLKNKRILFLGSSVTYGSGAGGVSFADIIGERYGAVCIQKAVSGTTLADTDEKSYVSRLKKVDKATKIDLFVCQLSTNDAKKKIPISEVKKAICFILDYVKNTFGCPVVFYTGTYFENSEYKEMTELLYALREEYSFHILDLYNDEEMLKVNEEKYRQYMKDPVHPTLLGYEEWWTPKFVDFLTQIT